MTSSKLNLLILPLLFAILLSAASKLKLGETVDNVFYTILTPIYRPVSFLRQKTDEQLSFVRSLPTLQKTNLILSSQNSELLSENESLKQQLSDLKNPSLKTNFKAVLPVHITGSIGTNTVSSSLSIDKVKIGQPLVSGKTLLGTVSEIKGSVINIKPLDQDRAEVLSVHTTSNQKGTYKFVSNTPQITGIPSLSPIILNDYVFTEPTELIPGNLVIGKIIKIISEAQEPLQKAEIRLDRSLSDNPENLVIVLEP